MEHFKNLEFGIYENKKKLLKNIVGMGTVISIIVKSKNMTVCYFQLD